jgi:hypothetical protein
VAAPFFAAALRLVLPRLRVAAPFFADVERLRLERLRVAAPFRAEALRPPRLRALLFRPDDADRELFRRRELLDFLAAAIKKLRVGGFVQRNSKIRAQQCCATPAYRATDINSNNQSRQRTRLAVLHHP